MSSSADSIATHERSTLDAEQRTSYLETQLRAVTADANALATDFMSRRDQLANENAYLSAQIAELGHIQDVHTHQIAHLAQEHLRLTAQHDDMTRRLHEVGQLLGGMGGHRTRLMGKVEEWEDGLMVAGREGWRAPATPRGGGDQTQKGLGGVLPDVAPAESQDGSATTTSSSSSSSSSSVGMGSLVSGAGAAEEDKDHGGGAPGISASDSGEAVFGGGGAAAASSF